MKRDDMKALLGTVGRYIRRTFEPRIKAVEDAAAQVPTLVERAVAALPPPKDGASLTPADVEPMLRRMVDEIELPEPAEIDVDIVSADTAKRLLASEDMRSLCSLLAAEAVAELPPAEKGADGKSVTVDEVVAALMPRLEDRIEAVVSRGLLDMERRAQGVLERAVAAIPKPKDGENGKDGRDGADFTTVEIDYDGERSITIRGHGAEITKRLPIPLDRGYWREGMAAEKGDIVTHDGTAWLALRDTKAKPALSEKDDWRIFARRGRDGERGPPGPTPPSDKPVPLA
jgi:hypothetical protein